MTLKIYSKDLLARKRNSIAMPPGLVLRDHVREVRSPKGGLVREFIDATDFGTEWNTRRQYEVDNGRDQEPILYTPFYSIIEDASLPKNVEIDSIGPAGVIMQQILPGGEVKFATIGSGQITVPILKYGVGLEYSEDLVLYNQLWNVAIVERQVGIAYNALLNDVHLSPFISYAYAAANQTAANTAGASVVENTMLTFEDAIVNARADTTNPRRGPYWILCSTADVFNIEKALITVPQVGVSLQAPSARAAIRGVVAYDGWIGTMGNLSVTYTGVTAHKAYLVDTAYQAKYLRSFMKIGLTNAMGNPDVSRFVLDQIVWSTHFGAYASPIATTEEVSLPTTA